MSEQRTEERGRRRATGRRAGDSGTRDAILDAARERFAELGYDRASLRAIAAAAGVDPALIRHFFTDKEHLFAAVMADRTTIADRLGTALAGPADGLGARVTEAYLGLWDDPEVQPILLGLVRSATTSTAAAELLLGALAARLLPASALGSADPERARRLALAASHLFGVAVGRVLLRIPPLAEASRRDLVAELAPVIQRYLDGTSAAR